MKKTAVVTGAAAGIGQAIALELAAAGYKVYANARSMEKIAGTLEKGRGYDIEPMIFDVRNPREIKEKLGIPDRIDCLVNNAGVSVPGNFRDMGEKEWNLTLETTVKG